MVGHDRAGVAGVVVLGDGLAECLCDEGELLCRELQQFVFKGDGGLVVKRVQVAAGGLELFPADVQVAKFDDEVVADRT